MEMIRPEQEKEILDYVNAHTHNDLIQLIHKSAKRYNDGEKPNKCIVHTKTIGSVFCNFEFENDDDVISVQHKECKMFLLYHTDMDGNASGAMMMNMVNALCDNIVDIETFAYNYSKKELDEILDKVYNYRHNNPNIATFGVIVDLSCMDNPRILKLFDYLIWADHHSTSEEDFHHILNRPSTILDIDTKCLFYIDTSCSATMLTADLFKDQLISRDNAKRYLYSSALVSIYDTKADKEYPLAYELALYLNNYYFDVPSTKLDDDMWVQLVYRPKYLDDILEAGKELTEIHKKKLSIIYQNSTKYIYKVADNIEVVGMAGAGNSLNFHPYKSKNGRDVIFALMRKNAKEDMCVISLYSDSERVKQANLGTFCRTEFGGGGHPGAAGFSIYGDKASGNTTIERDILVGDHPDFDIEYDKLYSCNMKDASIFSYVYEKLKEYLKTH